jgi:hypothetical protein
MRRARGDFPNLIVHPPAGLQFLGRKRTVQCLIRSVLLSFSDLREGS